MPSWSIVLNPPCAVASLVVEQTANGALRSSSSTTITSAGCFHPGECQIPPSTVKPRTSEDPLGHESGGSSISPKSVQPTTTSTTHVYSFVKPVKPRPNIASLILNPFRGSQKTKSTEPGSVPNTILSAETSVIIHQSALPKSALSHFSGTAFPAEGAQSTLSVDTPSTKPAATSKKTTNSLLELVSHLETARSWLAVAPSHLPLLFYSSLA